MIPKDKLYHLIAGFIISLIFGLISPLAGLVTSIGAGAAKEVIYDKLMKRGCFERLDFIATAFGGVIAYIIIIIL